MSSPTQTPPTISDSSDKISRLIGKLDANGIASFEADEFTTNGQSSSAPPPRSLKAALDAAKNARRKSGGTTPDSASEEDYDNLQHDTLTVIVGGKGGTFDRDGDVKVNREGTEAETRPDLQASKRSRPTPPKLKSIPITLKRADQKGQYYLIAEDVELREILKRGVEMVCNVNEVISTASKLIKCWRIIQCCRSGERSLVSWYSRDSLLHLIGLVHLYS